MVAARMGLFHDRMLKLMLLISDDFLWDLRQRNSAWEVTILIIKTFNKSASCDTSCHEVDVGVDAP
jgi:hypothetical protein